MSTQYATQCTALLILYLAVPYTFSCDTCVSFNPCAHTTNFIQPYLDCLMTNLMPHAQSVLERKFTIPGMTKEEIYVLICRTNAGAGPMLYGEFLKELKKEERQHSKEVGLNCHNKLHHL